MSDRDTGHMLEELQHARSMIEKLTHENERLLRAIEEWSMATSSLRLANEKLTDEVIRLRNEVSIYRVKQ